MKEIDGQQHLETGEIERAAVSEETLHLLQCQRCARLVLHYTETRHTTPLEQYPVAE